MKTVRYTGPRDVIPVRVPKGDDETEIKDVDLVPGREVELPEKIANAMIARGVALDPKAAKAAEQDTREGEAAADRAATAGDPATPAGGKPSTGRTRKPAEKETE